MKVLYSSDAIQRAVRMVMRPGGRRVAMVAFIGEGAERLLPKPAGMEVYCWPEPATSAKAVRHLMTRGARVFFAKKLHMKVYWSARRGAVVTSANLSANALGSGGLREAGVLLPRGAVSIGRLLNGVRARPVDEVTLQALERANAAAKTRRAKAGASGHTTFLEAIGQRGRWKIALVGGTTSVSERLKEAVKEDLPRGRPYDVMTARRNDAKEGDFILTLNVRPRARDLNPEWLFVQRKVLVATNDRVYDRDNPFQVAQVFEPRLCPPPPFRVDRAFRAALRRAVNEVGTELLPDVGRPSAKLIAAIKRNYR